MGNRHLTSVAGLPLPVALMLPRAYDAGNPWDYTRSKESSRIWDVAPRYSPPTPRSVRLGRKLRELRGKKTAAQAAAQVGYSQSWLSRVESGDIKIRPEELTRLLVAYGLSTDDEHTIALLALAANLDEPRWWQPLGSLQHRYLTYIGFEAEATVIRNWEQTLVPGLLQTPGYARAVLSVGREVREGITEERLEARLGRQTILTGAHPPELHVIVSEAVLLCQVGGPAVQRDQLRFLCKQSDLPNVTIQIVAFSAGEHLAAHYPLVLLDFAEYDPSPTLGCTEQLTGSWLLEAPQEIARLEEVFADLAEYAMTPRESVDWIWEASWQQ